MILVEKYDISLIQDEIINENKNIEMTNSNETLFDSMIEFEIELNKKNIIILSNELTNQEVIL